MEKERSFLLVSGIIGVMYMVFSFIISNYANLEFDLLSIVLYIVCTIGSSIFIFLGLNKKIPLERVRLLILLVSIVLFINNIISGILGFVVIGMINKRTLRELPKLEIESHYKPIVYVITFIISMLLTFVVPEFLTRAYQAYLVHIVMLLLNIYVFRHELIRDFKYFIKFFREYSYFSLGMYLKSLAVMFVLSLSIRMYTGIETATNQESIVESLATNTIYMVIIAVLYAPLVEEILFRGFFRKFIKNKYAFIIISGLLFGAAHVLDDFKSIEELLYILLYSSMGCFLAYTYYKTNNIFSNIMFHFTQNFVSIMAILFLSAFPGI